LYNKIYIKSTGFLDFEDGRVGEEVNITLKKFNRIARMLRINRMVLRSQRQYGTWDSNKDAEARPFNTEAQRRRNTEGRIEHRTQNNNLFF
jgi:hypothetical protein